MSISQHSTDSEAVLSVWLANNHLACYAPPPDVTPF